MSAGLVGVVVGGVVGVLGGVVGSYCSIRNTKNPDERRFVVKCAVVCWLIVSLSIAVLLFAPHSNRIYLWAPYGLVMVWGIPWVNRRQVQLRAQSDPSIVPPVPVSAAHFCRRPFFAPRFSGLLELDNVPDDYVERLEDRVRDGFLLRGSRTRADYSSSRIDGGVRIVADNMWTAMNVGLNDVEVRRVDDRHVAYRVSYRRWAGYGVGLCACVISLIAVAMVVTIFLEVPGSLQRVTPSVVVSALFFGLVFPWILIEGHKKPAASGLERILREELQPGCPILSAGKGGGRTSCQRVPFQ